jgi:hypothetical protein
MESKKINQLATNVAPQSTDLTIIGDPITGVSKKITWLQVSTLIGTAANLQQVTDNGATTTNAIAIGGLTITGLATGVLKSDSGVISSVPFGAANGVATLGGDGKVPSIQLPSYVDDVVEVANFAALPATGETGKIYITLDNNKVYRWTGSIYVEIAANNAVWGAITGTLSNQTDLQNALNAKQNTITLTTTGTSGASTLVGSTLNIPNYSTDLSGYVPYTGATANLNLGTFDLTADVITGATGSFASNGSSNTFAINHSSGSGIALNITKGGNGEGLYINKTSGSGNAATIIGTLNATTLVKSGGTSSQFLKADGSVDSSAYITLTSLSAGTGISYNNTTGVITSTITQYTDALARAALSVTAPLTYNSSTGVFNINQSSSTVSGWLSFTDWNTFNDKASTASLANYLPLAGGTLTGQLVINRASGNGLQVASDNVVITAATGFGSPRQLVFTCGNGPTTTLEAKGFGGNYITDFNIKTYNSSGTAFNVFFGTSAGDVGIGTDTPLSKLQVVSTGTVLRLGEASGTTGKQLLFGVDSASGRGEIQAVWQGTSNTPLGLNVAGGNVLIGTTTDNGTKLNVSGTGTFSGSVTFGSDLFTYANGGIFFSGGGTYTSGIFQNASGLNLQSGGSPRLTITSGGNVGIGTPSQWTLGGYTALEMNNTGLIYAGTGNMAFVNNGYYDGAWKYKSNNFATLYSTDGGAHQFLTAPSGTVGNLLSWTERMRILGSISGTSSVLIGSTSSNWDTTNRGTLEISGSGTSLLGLKVGSTPKAYFYTTGTDTYINNEVNGGKIFCVAFSAGVYLSTGATSWTANSDERLKNIKGNIENAIEKLMTLRTVNFSWKSDNDNKENLGLIAQDVEKVFPQVIDKNKLPTNANYEQLDKTEYLGVRYQELVPVLVKAIQEQQAQIEELKAKIK